MNKTFDSENLIILKIKFFQVAEKKIMDIEEELKIVGANMQTLEMSEEKTMKREEGLQEEILELR